MKKILAVIVTYNRLSLLKKTVAAIEAQNAACDILLVNNASTDETESWALSFDDSELRDRNRRFLYENTGANLGGAGGFQYGIRKGVELGYDAVWIMDDDAIPKPETLRKLLEADARLSDETGQPSYGFLSSVVRWTDGSLCEMNRQRLPSHYVQEDDIAAARSGGKQTPTECNRTPGSASLPTRSGGSWLPVECATFVSLLIPKETVLKVGLPIKEFFIWSDDIEYTSRITRRYHLPAFLIPESEIIHETKNNIGSDIVYDEAERIERYRYAYRNGCYAYRHYSARMFLSFLYRTFQTFFRIFAKAKDNKGKRARILLKGLFQGFVFHPKVEFLALNHEA